MSTDILKKTGDEFYKRRQKYGRVTLRTEIKCDMEAQDHV